jgi:cytochrome P450 monooxygenase
MTAPDLPVLESDKLVVGRLSPLMRDLRTIGPVVKVRTATGDEAWLVTRYAELKQLLRDNRLGNSHPDPENRPKHFDNPLLDMTIVKEEPEVAREMHMMVRNALTPHFSAMRMNELRPRIAKHVENLLDQIEAEQQPVDLHNRLSMPLSFDSLCDLVGVTDKMRFMAMLEGVGQVNTADGAGGVQATLGYLAELVADRKANGGDDLIAALVEAGHPDEFVCVLIMIVCASYMNTPHNLSAGIALLATNPDQRDKLVQDPELVPTAVEEMLRISRAGASCLPRYANADIEIADIVIKPGELVLCDHYAGNFDDRMFDEPERFDVTRSPNPHLSFSFGMTHCIGAPLARLELQEAFAGLLRRMPNLGLAVPIEELPMLDEEANDQLGGGIVRLPVTW